MSLRENFQQALDLIGTMVNGGTLKAYLDGGPTLEEIVIETDLDAADFTLVVEVDGDRRVQMTGTQLNAREAYEGRTATAGQFVFAFSDPMARLFQGDAMTALTTQPHQRVLVSLELAAAGVVGTETATIYTETTPNRPEEFRLYCLPEAIPVSQIGENQFDGFRRGSVPGQNKIRRIFNYGAITHVSVEQDRRSLYGKREMPKAVNDARLLRNGKTVPAACYVLDFVAKGNVIVDLLDTFSREAFRFTFTTSDANDITAVTEYVQAVATKRAA